MFHFLWTHRWPKESSDKFGEMSEHAHLKVLVSEVSSLWLPSLIKKSNSLIDFFQWYWWSITPAIWLQKRAFWPAI